MEKIHKCGGCGRIIDLDDEHETNPELCLVCRIESDRFGWFQRMKEANMNGE